MRRQQQKRKQVVPNFLVRNVRNNLLSLIRDLKVQSKERWQLKGLTGSKTGETGTKRRRQEKYKPKPTEPENKGNLNKFTNEPVEESKKPINYRPKAY